MPRKKQRPAGDVLDEIERVTAEIETHDAKADELRDRRIDLWVEAVQSTPKPTHRQIADRSGVGESFVTRKLRSRGVMAR